MPDSALPRPDILRLPADVINRIAAGEVVERPAAAVKELVENAIDAGARKISVILEGGGLTRLSVADDGCGLAPEDLRLALERHATSKLKPDASGAIDLLNIRSLGFRGEALASIAAVSRMILTSRAGEDAAELIIEAGRIDGPKPAAFTGHGATGTRVDVRDLFFATPARLKFMKGERAETLAVTDAVKRLAMAHADVAFSLETDGRVVFRVAAERSGDEGRLNRLGAVLGKSFADNCIAIETEREGVRLSGFAGLPTFSRGNAQLQYLFVNGRPVKDRLMTGVVRAAYQDFLARDRHPIVALFLELDPEEVDVNVHPAKTEVRFRDAGLIRGLMIGALRHGLAGAGHRASTTVSGFALGRARPEGAPTGPLFSPVMASRWGQRPAPVADLRGGVSERGAEAFDHGLPPATRVETQVESASDAYPLGAAKAQLHETYIIAETADGIVIVDQHAAHERLVYERMKHELATRGVQKQALLIPDIVTLTEDEAARLVQHTEQLAEWGLEIEAFGRGAICVRATPSLFGEMDTAGLLQDLADDFAEYEAGLALSEKFEDVMGNMACRSSVRAGRRLNAQEMNALLREMEVTPYSGQCNHGRPTYVELKRADIERLFGRRG